MIWDLDDGPLLFQLATSGAVCVTQADAMVIRSLALLIEPEFVLLDIRSIVG